MDSCYAVLYQRGGSYKGYNWIEAKYICQMHGGHLVYVENERESEVITAEMLARVDDDGKVRIKLQL